MANSYRYYIGSNSYNDLMNDKTRQYQNLVRRAEILNRDNGGKATKEEGRLYREAAAVCEEIVNLNRSNRSTEERWRMLQRDCEAEVDRIVNELAPPAPPATQAAGPAQAAANAATIPVRAGSGSAAAGGVSKTASGFTTKNASKDVPADTIEKWYKNKPGHSLQDVIGMDDQKNMLCQAINDMNWELTGSALGLSPFHSFFFYGPPGCGKSYLIEAFTADMMEKGFKFLQLTGSEIHASLVGVAEKTVQAAFAEAIDNEPCILYIDEIDNVCVNRDNPHIEGHEKRLTVAFLEAYNMLKTARKRVVFVGATNHPEMVDEAMLDRITLIRVPLPDVKVRESYFERNFSEVHPQGDFTYGDMASLTDNYSFRDLDHLKDGILRKLLPQITEEYRVLDAGGEVNIKSTDAAASDAINEGKVILTKEMFEETRAMFHPSSKVNIRAALEQFEARRDM